MHVAPTKDWNALGVGVSAKQSIEGLSGSVFKANVDCMPYPSILALHHFL